MSEVEYDEACGHFHRPDEGCPDGYGGCGSYLCCQPADLDIPDQDQDED